MRSYNAPSAGSAMSFTPDRIQRVPRSTRRTRSKPQLWTISVALLDHGEIVPARGMTRARALPGRSPGYGPCGAGRRGTGLHAGLRCERVRICAGTSIGCAGRWGRSAEQARESGELFLVERGGRIHEVRCPRGNPGDRGEVPPQPGERLPQPELRQRGGTRQVVPGHRRKRGDRPAVGRGFAGGSAA